MKKMTEGTPWKLILFFTIPLVFGSILQQLYNMGDGKMVSHFIGKYAFGAVGLTAVVSNTLIGLINGFTQGFGILVGHSFGAGDMKRVKRCIAGSVIITGALVVILTAFGLGFIDKILIKLDTPEDIFPHAISYVRIILCGIVFTGLYNLCANVLRALGDSKTPLYCLALSVVLNLGLDYLMVGVMNLGIQGAAYATIISQFICSSVCLIYALTHFREVIPGVDDWRDAAREIKELFATGLSMGFMGCIVNIGTIVLQRAINDLGPDIVVAQKAGRTLLDTMMIMIFSYGFTMTTYVSQNVGAGRIDRVKLGVKSALVLSTSVSILLFFACRVVARPIVAWVASTTDPFVIDNGVMYCRTGVSFFVVLGPLFILRCTLQGLGHKIVPLFSSVLELVTKILSAMFLVPIFKYRGVAFTEPISWILMTTMLTIMYVHYIKIDSGKKVLE